MQALRVPATQVSAAVSNVRRSGASAEQERQLRDSIAALGILQPLLVRPIEAGGYEVIEGHRRLRAAIDLALPEIPVVVHAAGDAAHMAMQAAANLVRAPLEPVDQWRVLVALQGQGYSLEGASQALGLSERRARQLDRLGRLHPRLLDEIATHGLPDELRLRQVAAADLDAQQAALKLPRVWEGTGARRMIVWFALADALQVGRISRSRAIFDHALMPWDEDLFAQPDSPEQYSTTDSNTFLHHQREALVVQAAAARKPRAAIAEWDAKRGAPALPKGWKTTWDKRAAGCVRYLCVTPSGYSIGAVAEVLATPPPKPKAAAPGSASPAEPPEEAPPASRGPLTQRGREMLSDIQTQAIHAALLHQPEAREESEWLELLLLALCASNVTVQGHPTDRYRHTDFHDIAAQLLDSQGAQRELAAGATRRMAAEVLSRILLMPRPGHMGSGEAAGWIANWIDAKGHMPRLDTEDFLATWSADALRAGAEDVGQLSTGTAKALRTRLAGHAPQLWLEEAEFHVKGPQPEPEDDGEAHA